MTLSGPKMGNVLCRFGDMSPTCQPTRHCRPKIADTDIRHSQLSARRHSCTYFFFWWSLQMLQPSQQTMTPTDDPSTLHFSHNILASIINWQFLRDNFTHNFFHDFALTHHHRSQSLLLVLLVITHHVLILLVILIYHDGKRGWKLGGSIVKADGRGVGNHKCSGSSRRGGLYSYYFWSLLLLGWCLLANLSFYPSKKV